MALAPTKGEKRAAAMAAVRLFGGPTCVQFLNSTNGGPRTSCRTFSQEDYWDFCVALWECDLAVQNNEPYWASDDAGGVARSYKYPAQSAAWAVWNEPGHGTSWAAARQRCGQHVTCLRHGGERSYVADWKKWHKDNS